MKYAFSGKIEILPMQLNWFFVPLSKKLSEELKPLSQRSIVPIEAKIGKTKWPTSLLPLGDGHLFLALNKKVMKKEDLYLGQKLKIELKIRKQT